MSFTDLPTSDILNSLPKPDTYDADIEDMIYMEADLQFEFIEIITLYTHIRTLTNSYLGTCISVDGGVLTNIEKYIEDKYLNLKDLIYNNIFNISLII